MGLDRRDMGILAAQAASLRAATEKLDNPDALGRAATEKLDNPDALGTAPEAPPPASTTPPATTDATINPPTEVVLTPQSVRQIQTFVEAHLSREDLDADGDGKMSLADWNAMYYKMVGAVGQPAAGEGKDEASAAAAAGFQCEEREEEQQKMTQAGGANKPTSTQAAAALSIEQEGDLVGEKRPSQVFSMAEASRKEGEQTNEAAPPREYWPEKDQTGRDRMIWHEQLSLWVPAWYPNRTALSRTVTPTPNRRYQNGAEPVHTDINTEIYKKHWQPPAAAVEEEAPCPERELAPISVTIASWQSQLREGDDKPLSSPPPEGNRLFPPARSRVPAGHNVMNRLYRDRSNPQPLPSSGGRKKVLPAEPIHSQRELVLRDALGGCTTVSSSPPAAGKWSGQGLRVPDSQIMESLISQPVLVTSSVGNDTPAGPAIPEPLLPALPLPGEDYLVRQVAHRTSVKQIREHAPIYQRRRALPFSSASTAKSNAQRRGPEDELKKLERELIQLKMEQEDAAKQTSCRPGASRAAP